MSRDETGASFILALLFIILTSLPMVALVGLAQGNMMSTTNLQSQRGLLYAADGAVEAAIQDVRYSGASYSTAAGCSHAGMPQLNGTSITVDCSSGGPSSGRLVVFTACNGTALPCPAALTVLTAHVLFVDSPTTGTSATIESWVVQSVQGSGLQITSVTPASLAQGASNQTVVVGGTGFESGASIAISGSGVTINSTTWNSSTQMTLVLTVAGNAPIGASDVKVTNPGVDGFTATCSGCFSVTGPAPTISSISPTSVVQGQSTTLTINGTNFQTGVTVSFSNSGVTPGTVTSTSSKITVPITVDPSAPTGAGDVTISNPDATTAKCGSCLTVDALPTISGVSPTKLGQGASTTLTINGTNFQSGASVTFSNGGVSTSGSATVTPTQITVPVTVTTGAATGAGDVTVTNPDTGSATCTGCLTIDQKPTVSSIAPTTITQGSSAVAFTVNGTNFQNGATITFSGTGVSSSAVVFVSSTKLTALVSATSSATIGKINVIVTNPDFGTGTCGNCLTIKSTPTITVVSPGALDRTAANATLTITGTNFVGGATVSFSNTRVTTAGGATVTSTKITVPVNVANNASLGLGDVTVTNSDGGTVTCVGCLTVAGPPSITSLSPSSMAHGTSGQVTLNGTGFVNDDQLAVTITGHAGVTVTSVTWVSATQLTLQVTVASSATVGSYKVNLVNGDGSPGSLNNGFSVT